MVLRNSIHLHMILMHYYSCSCEMFVDVFAYTEASCEMFVDVFAYTEADSRSVSRPVSANAGRASAGFSCKSRHSQRQTGLPRMICCCLKMSL